MDANSRAPLSVVTPAPDVPGSPTSDAEPPPRPLPLEDPLRDIYVDCDDELGDPRVPRSIRDSVR